MEAFDTVNTFRKLQLDTSLPLQRHHAGSSSLSLSLSASGSRSGLASTPRAPPSTTSSTTQTPTPATPIAVRISQPRTLDPYNQQCSDTPELSSSGRYAQSNFILSPLERAARAESSSLFEHFQPKAQKPGSRGLGGDGQLDVRKRVVPTLAQQEQITQHVAQTGAQNPDERGVFRKKSPPVRSNTESEKFNYDFSSGRRREATSGISSELIRENEITSFGDKGVEAGSGPNYKAIEPTSLMNQPRRRFLSPSPFEKMMEDQDRMSSLTSDSTVGTPLSEALATPTDSECSELYGPPLTHAARCQSFQDPISLGETSAWPGNLNAVHRNKSYNFEIAQPSSARRKRRAFSEKRMSPANQFLSGWACQKAPEPDDEGQEVGAYVIGKQIGFGGFSVVKEATTMKNGMKVVRAVKIVRKQAHSVERENDKIQAEFEREVSIWRYLSHPHILPLIEVYDTPHATFCFTKLVSGGTLFDLVKKNRQGLPAHVAQKYTYQLASAIRYLHEDVRIIHRDIKLENCLIDISVDEGSLLLCDFGMAEQIPGSNDDDSDSESSYTSDGRRRNRRDSTVDIKGSLQYASPEMMAITAPPLSTAVDMWAFGVVIYALHTGDLPFNHSFQPKLQMMIAKGDWDVERFRNSEAFMGDQEMARMALSVVKGCLCKNPERRWTIGMVLESEWLEQFFVETP